jgi:hypothetical protein
MTLNNVLFMLFGAALIAIGVLAAALADRIRGLKIARERVPHETLAPRVRRPQIEVVEAELVPPEPKRPRGIMADVIAALVAAGYKKAIATEAVQGCSLSDRATIEDWTRAALRRAVCS